MATSPDNTHADDVLQDDFSGACASQSTSPSTNARWLLALVCTIGFTWWLRGWMASHPTQPPAQVFVAAPEGKTAPQSTAKSAGKNQPASHITNASASASASANANAAAGNILVHVAGKVKKPGVYALAPSSRVRDAIATAGGATKDGDADALNLAAWAEDGQRLEVPIKESAQTEIPSRVAQPRVAQPRVSGSRVSGSRPSKVRLNSGVLSPRMSVATPKAKSGKSSIGELAKHPIDLNRASEAELQALPGVGPAMAARILAYRKENGGFKVVDDLDNVRGVGEKRMEILRPLVTVR